MILSWLLHFPWRFFTWIHIPLSSWISAIVLVLDSYFLCGVSQVYFPHLPPLSVSETAAETAILTPHGASISHDARVCMFVQPLQMKYLIYKVHNNTFLFNLNVFFHKKYSFSRILLLSMWNKDK